tara:strand:- start:5728 stop:6801 length:1074 start_codon:yes stop_codon:yes gene_type:complete
MKIEAKPLKFHCGTIMKNRFMLAPLTNTQSHDNGVLSDAEFKWLTMRAQGGFGLVMTCASHVQANGKGFPGQLGIFSDSHIEGHKRLANELKLHGSLAVIQLHHAGMRAPKELINQQPVCPSINEKADARALTLNEIKTVITAFIKAALRAKTSGYNGVEIHGAHGYLLCQFLSKETNKRTDIYGGSLENRSRIIFEIVEGIRAACGSGFLIGIRLSPERFGMELIETKVIAQKLMDSKQIDFLDMSLWDCFKLPEDSNYQDKSLLEHFTSLNFKDVKLTVAGKISSGNDVSKILNSKVDFVTIGRSAILHHDFPNRVLEDPNFQPHPLPVSQTYLKKERLSDAFISYMSKWPNFVK